MAKVVQSPPADEPITKGIKSTGQEKEHNETPSDQWPEDFAPPAQLPISHPWLSRYYASAILYADNGPAGSDTINTTETKVYGNNVHPIAFRIGNGGAGYTRILRVLALKFIWTHGNDFRIGWVANHSRFTQAALLGDVVQIALTYEPENEELAVREGWAERICKPAFWDHFILVGPKSNPAGVEARCDVSKAFKQVAREDAVFHTRGDGSATFERTQKLFKAADIDSSSASWIHTHALAPFQALERADKDSAYTLTDRATFLTAKQAGVIPELVVYVESRDQLQNPCSALINTKVPESPGQRMAVTFAEWLKGETAQGIISGYGRVWDIGLPLFTPAEREDFGDEEGLVGWEF